MTPALAVEERPRLRSDRRGRARKAGPDEIGHATRNAGGRGRREGLKERVARRVGRSPSTRDVVVDWIAAALPPDRKAAALDAGCGQKSLLQPLRARLSPVIGVDLHAPDRPMRWLDDFVVADVCRDRDAFPEATFDVVLSNFTVEHFSDPPAAYATLSRWLKPGGWLIIATVNRRHPFVDVYLSLPTSLRGRLQRLVKRSVEDAHPLVGASNTPDLIREGLRAVGLTDIELVTTSHLSRAWGRTLPTWALGLLGDIATAAMPERRSTIVARARREIASSTG